MVILAVSFTKISSEALAPACPVAAVALALSALTATPVMADPVAGKPLAVTVFVTIAEPALLSDAPLTWSWVGILATALAGACSTESLWALLTLLKIKIASPNTNKIPPMTKGLIRTLGRASRLSVPIGCIGALMTVAYFCLRVAGYWASKLCATRFLSKPKKRP